MASAAAALTALRAVRSQLEAGLAAEKESTAQLQRRAAQATAKYAHRSASCPSHLLPPSAPSESTASASRKI